MARKMTSERRRLSTRMASFVDHPGFGAHLSSLGRCSHADQVRRGYQGQGGALVLDHREDYDSEWAAITAVSSRLGMTAETLRKWGAPARGRRRPS